MNGVDLINMTEWLTILMQNLMYFFMWDSERGWGLNSQNIKIGVVFNMKEIPVLASKQYCKCKISSKKYRRKYIWSLSCEYLREKR